MKWLEAFRKKRIPPENKAPHAEVVGNDAQQGQASPPLSADEQFEKLRLLTPRERDLFLLLIKGYTLKESAKQLSVKYSTVNTHMTGIYKKLNVNSRAELIIRYRDAVKRNE